VNSLRKAREETEGSAGTGDTLAALRTSGAVFAMVLLSVAALASAIAVRAAAAGGPEFLVQFGVTGTGAGQTVNPRGVATDPTTGHVYVAEFGNRRISEFTAWGQFVKAFGWGVADGTTAALQTCTTTCFKGLNGSGAGQLGGESALGVAVDGLGNVYVVDRGNRRVQKFDSSGNFLLMFGGEVNKTTGENVCTKVQFEAGNVCGAGTTGAGQGQFGAWKIGSFIGIGPSNTVYVGDNNRIQQFNSDGTFNSEIELPGAGFVESLAVDPSGDLYVANEQSLVPGIRKLSPSGTVLNTITKAVNGKGESVAVFPKALATDSSGNLYEVDDQPGESPPEVFKFNAGGEQKASFGEGEFTASTGIGTNTAGDVYITNATPSNSYIRAYGPLPTKFEPPPSAPPTIGAEYAASVGTTGAVVKAEINPHFFPTTYYVEYGSADCESSPCAQQPASPGASLNGERDRFYPTADVSLQGLTPGTTYHYRFVAISESGTVFGPDRTFKTYLPGAFGLPDGRAFEMVSPPEKNSAELGAPGNAGGLVDPGFSVTPLQASVTGEAIAYPSFTSFGDAQSAPAASTYLSKRSATGWLTENITPPNREGYTRDPFRGFSGDLSVGAVIQKEPVLAPGAIEGFENLYLRDNDSGELSALTTETPGTSDPEHYCVSFAGASESFDRVIFVATGALTPEAPETPGVSLYEWAAGKLSLVSVLPGGTPAQPAPQTSFGAVGTGQGNGCEMNGNIVRHAISTDGSRIFWTYAPPAEATQLLARLDGADTVQLDATQGGLGPGGEGRFWAASDDGSKVFFTDPNELTPDASNASSGGGSLGDLYEYDFDAEPGEELTDITVDPTPGTDPPAVRGVLGTSEDGSYVYFVANGVLSGEEENGQEEKAEPEKPNLYVWHAGGGVRFIGTLSTTDGRSWSSVPKEQTARVTPDGLQVAFVSAASLTGFDNVDQSSGKPASQVYLYSADSDELTCASCNPSGARPIGFSELPAWITPYEQPRYLSDDGARLFFPSFDALALGDTNGTQDVYEFEREGAGSCSSDSAAFSPTSGGCLYLISSGRSGDDSHFLDASSDGRDAFFSTRQGLYPADEDERFDVYDARIGGGFPPPTQPPPICAGEACRPTQAAPSIGSPSTSGFVGEGNVKASPRHHGRRCAKGKHKVRRHGKTRCVPRHGRAHHGRRAAR
jgi:NHL repeat